MRGLSIISLVLLGACHAIDTEQQPLHDLDGPKDELIHRLVAAEIVPQLIDAFIPVVNVSVSWKHGLAEYGNSLNPKDTKKAPEVDLIDWPGLPSELDEDILKKHKSTQLTIVLTDPDAPSYDNPKWSQMCHWIATRLPLNIGDAEAESTSFKEIVKYKAPGPPKKTGSHRYIFIALAPLNGTTDKLHLNKPKDRQRWGYEGERAGVREWANEHGLGVIGANFIYAQNAKQ